MHFMLCYTYIGRVHHSRFHHVSRLSQDSGSKTLSIIVANNSTYMYNLTAMILAVK